MSKPYPPTHAVARRTARRTPRAMHAAHETRMSDVLRRARALTHALTDAISRCEVNTWSAPTVDALGTDADAMELDALTSIARAMEDMTELLYAFESGAANARDARAQARLSADLERARRLVFSASARALERVNGEREVCREALAFVEMPGDREYVDVVEQYNPEDEHKVSKMTAEPLKTNTFLRAANDEDFAASYGVDQFGIRPMTPVNAPAGVDDMYFGRLDSPVVAYGESDSVKSCDYSPGGMSEDSARYYNDRDVGSDDHTAKSGDAKAKQRSSEKNGQGWLAFALGAVLAGGVMRFAGSPQAAALGAEARRRATEAKKRATNAARDSVIATTKAVGNTVNAQRARFAAQKSQRASDIKNSDVKGASEEPMYEVVHTRATLNNDAGLRGMDRERTRAIATVRVGDEFATMPARDFRWKPNVLLGRG